jgi:hypothetical protein
MTDDSNSELIVSENEASKKVRMLNFDIAGSKFKEVDGGLLVTDVLALDEGTWADSAVGTPLYYTTKALSESVGNWKQTGFWTRHAGGSPRSLTDKVGRVLNPRFVNTGMCVDIFLHKRSQASKDMADMMQSGEADAVSIEHGGEEVYNKALDRWETKSLTYYGLAAVDKGACETCKIRHQEVKVDDSLQSRSATEQIVAETVSVENKKQECEEMDEELKKALSDFDIRLKAIEGSLSEAKAGSEKEMSEKAELVKQLGEMTERIKKIESEPKQKALGSPEVPEMRVKADLPKLL